MAKTGSITVHVSRFTEQGLIFEVMEFSKVVGATITDDNQSITYDYETGNVTVEKGGQDTPITTGLEKEPVTI